MTNLESSPAVFCESIMQLTPEERYDRLKDLNGNGLFWEVVRLRPSLFEEFTWHEKRDYLESILIEPVDRRVLQTIVSSGRKGLGPTSLADLLIASVEGDEFWRFEATPGDKGFAIVRSGRVVDYSVIEITCI